MQRAINELKAARAKAIKELQALAVRAGRELDGSEKGTYSNLKRQLLIMIAR